MSLSAFFAQNAVTETTEEIVVSDRFKGEDGKPAKWVIRAMTEEESEVLRKASTKRAKVKGQFITETDQYEYLAKLVVASVVFPDLKNAELQNSYGVRGAENLLRKMLKPGEFVDLVTAVQEINGYEKETSELMDDVKN
ncbi:phage portal protein [Tumebacillus algifaecis]|uniref:Phage portal protein n=1 Tax=Tumebacillus algifaecis TaxID=1214604 RepID=A0A223D5J1_9BACL|nr:phage portal protein [Tumebacillus algifaecis]ASS76815.1 phage portal protein [Tumebacillus algifaecis]